MEEFNQGRHKPLGDDAVHCQFDLTVSVSSSSKSNQWVSREQRGITSKQFGGNRLC
jgi:hypothetical protein